MSEDPPECPLCMEVLELDDISFFPCTCGYQICRFCWHRIRMIENGTCPACRKPYPENPAHFKPITNDEINNIKKEKKMREVIERQRTIDSRKHFGDLRVIQKNLMFVFGLPSSITDPEVLKKQEYFGRFGKIQKVTLTRQTNGSTNNNHPSQSAYITFFRVEDTLRAIRSINCLLTHGKNVKASLGTTKYCSRFLKGFQCLKQDCMYLHETVEEEASFTKEEIQQGKHTPYEQKLYNQFCSSNETSAPSSATSTATASNTTTTTSATALNNDFRVNNSSGDARSYNKAIGSVPKNNHDDRKLQNNISSRTNNKQTSSTPKKVGTGSQTNARSLSTATTNQKVSNNHTTLKNDSVTNLTPKSNRSKKKGALQPGMSKRSIYSLFPSTIEIDTTLQANLTEENVGDCMTGVGLAAPHEHIASIENVMLEVEKETTFEKNEDVVELLRPVPNDGLVVSDENETVSNKQSFQLGAGGRREVSVSDLEDEDHLEVKEKEVVDVIRTEEGADDDENKSKSAQDSSEDDNRKSICSTNGYGNINENDLSKNASDDNDDERGDVQRVERHNNFDAFIAVPDNNVDGDSDASSLNRGTTFKMDPMMREMLDNLDSSVLDGCRDNYNNAASSSGTEDEVGPEDHRDDDLGFDPWSMCHQGFSDMLEKEKFSELTIQDKIQQQQQDQLRMKEICEHPQQQNTSLFEAFFGKGWESRTSSLPSREVVGNNNVDSFGCISGLTELEAHRNSFHQHPNHGLLSTMSHPNHGLLPTMTHQATNHQLHGPSYPFSPFDSYGNRARMSSVVGSSQDLHNQSYSHDNHFNNSYLYQQQLHQQQLQQEHARYLYQQQLLNQQQQHAANHFLTRQQQMLDQQQYMQQQSVSEQKKWQEGLKAIFPNVNISFGPRPPFVKGENSASMAPPTFISAVPRNVNDHVAYQNIHGNQFPQEDLHRRMVPSHELNSFDPAIINAGNVARSDKHRQGFQMNSYENSIHSRTSISSQANQLFAGQRSSSYRPPYADDQSQSKFTASGPVVNWENHAQECNTQRVDSLQPTALPTTTTVRTAVIQPPPGFEKVRPGRGDFV